MIFFNVPSVGQLKPSTCFGEDENHYGFIQSVVGEEYKASVISQLCNDYYFKPKEVEYWGRIITLVRFAGLKRLNPSNRILSIPLLDFIQREYDKKNKEVADIWLNYFLCKWQHPHPSLEKKSEQRTRPIFKPYALILSILIELLKRDDSLCYLTNDEFYWLGHSYHEGIINTKIDNVKNLVNIILDMRSNGGWDKFQTIKFSKTHLAYPSGLLENSKILTPRKELFKIPDNRKLFIGLDLGIDNVIKISQQLINYTESNKFTFNPALSYLDKNLEAKFSKYLNNRDDFGNWIAGIDLYEHTNLLDTIKDQEPFDDSDYLHYKKVQAKFQLERLAVLDREVKTRQRTEQKILREYLFKNETGKCAICNKKFPIEFCACAHIKKRSKCNDDEKRDLNVVMPACYFGCDSLFEKGYITIVDGIVKDNHYGKTSTSDTINYINQIVGNNCEYYNDNSKKYFNWHNEKFLDNV